jgi:hypothetical protein
MFFSNNYRKSSVSYQKTQMQMQMNSIPIQYSNPARIQQVSPEPTPPVPQVKLKWGKPIWTFFHTMAQKMKDEYFTVLIGGFMKMIVSICSVLPCPVCSKHAIEYINSININNIRSKNDLINFFYNFHNVVNKKKGYPMFRREDVIKTYENANTYAVIQEFMFHFEDKQRSSKLIVDDFLRRRVTPEIKTWINTHIQYFSP